MMIMDAADVGRPSHLVSALYCTYDGKANNTRTEQEAAEVIAKIKKAAKAIERQLAAPEDIGDLYHAVDYLTARAQRWKYH